MTDDIVENILKERYYQPDETCWEDIAERVANALFDDVGVHNDKKLCKEYLNSKKFIFNSPTLMNAGTEMGQLSACFCMPIKDDMSDIYDTIRKSALIFQSGGGVGINWSTLRPEGAPVGKYTVNTNPKKEDYGEEHFSNYMHHTPPITGIKTASGPIAFMKSFDSMVETVKSAGSRRGAAIAILNDNHPDIFKFVKSKNEEGSFSNFNISVMLTDNFMQLVENDCDWDLHFDGKVYQTIKSRDLFNEICKSAWTRAEPGVLFYDTINKDNPMKGEFGDITTCNPCVSGDTLILTNNGYVPIVELIGKETTIWNGYEWSNVIPFKTSDSEELFEVTFTNGSVINCTSYHKFPIWFNGRYQKYEKELELLDCKIGDALTKYVYPIITGENVLMNAYTNGFYSGDGSYNKEKKREMIYLYHDKLKLIKHFESIHNYWEESDANRIVVVFNRNSIMPKFFVPNASYNIESRINWLSGIIDADGTRNSKEGSVTISSINKEFLHDIKLMLNTLGVNSTVALVRSETVKEMPDGRGGYANYYCNDCYKLVISGWNVLNLKQLGLHTYRVNNDIDHLLDRDASRFIRIKSIIPTGIYEPVYCLTEEKRHRMIANGILTSQCSEQPLCVDFKTGGGEACVLGSIDISKLTYDDGYVNFAGIEEVTRFAVRALDRIVDINKYPLPEIKDCVMKGRKIGLGIMGFADALLKKGISYGSEESLDLIDGIMSFVRRIADDESIRIGNGKKKNACTLTCAPTGSLALFANCSSGIEPNFGWVYNRSTWVDGEKKTYRMVHPLFENYYKNDVNYEKILDYVEKNGTLKDCQYVNQEDSDIFCVAKDITPLDHVKVQARFQKHVDSSIAKTVNCPNSTTVENIYDIYMEAWKSGCKGITIYREGSRNDVVLETNKSETTTLDVEISNPVQYKLLTAESGRILPKTPRECPATQFKRNSGCGHIIISIGEVDGKPHTVTVENAGSGGCTALQKIVARLIALALRWGIPTWDIFSALNVRCDVAVKNKKSDGISCGAIIGHILKDFYPYENAPSKDDTKEPTLQSDEIKNTPTSSTICPDCGEMLVFAEGCVICKHCGFSKCS